MLAVVALHIVPPVLFALFHGAVSYSLRGIIVFVLICLIVGGAVENFGVLTGIPFGHYYFTSVMGPKILFVPALLALAYVGMAYLSWTLAILILRQASSSVLAGSPSVTVPLVASFIMVAWDVAMDPVWSTILHAWIWRDGGIYFGVPISNFLGWFFTVYLILQLFAVYVRKRSTSVDPLPRNYWNLAILFYATSAAGNLLLLLPRHGPSVVSDPTGARWHVAGITAATALASVFAMGVPALLAWTRSPQQ
jgi:putative membrane protein